jgi:FkbM family methyltransferase
MKRKIIDFLNKFISPFHAKIVSKRAGSFNMLDALQRVNAHQFQVNTIIDIGASNGKWSLMAINTFPGCKVFAIEPLSEQKTALDKLKKTKISFNYASCVLGASDGNSVTINVSPDLDGSTVGGSGGESRLVVERTLDSLAKEYSLLGPYILKFDTHGYELPIIKSAELVLRETNVVIMEVYNFNFVDHALRFHEMCSYMESLGFRCYDMADPMLREHDRSLWQMDFFFCRQNSSIFDCQSYR